MDDDDFAALFKKLPSGASTGTSWQDLITEFEALGNTLGDVLRSAWQRQGDQAALGRLRESLESLIQDVNRTIDGTPEGQRARDQLVQMIDSIREATERVGDELRPELVNLLRQANTELRRFTRLDE